MWTLTPSKPWAAMRNIQSVIHRLAAYVSVMPGTPPQEAELVSVIRTRRCAFLACSRMTVRRAAMRRNVASLSRLSSVVRSLDVAFGQAFVA